MYKFSAELTAQKKARRKLKEWATASGTPFKLQPEISFTSIKKSDKKVGRKASGQARKTITEAAANIMDSSPDHQYHDYSSEDEDYRAPAYTERKLSQGGMGKKRGRPAKKPMSRRFTHKKTHTVSRAPTAARGSGAQEENVDIEGVVDMGHEMMDEEQQVKQDTEKTIAENEQFILDILSSRQPYHDHSYTTIFGKRRGIETIQLDAETLDELQKEDTARTAGNLYFDWDGMSLLSLKGWVM